MNSDRDLDLLMDQWLAGGPTDPADRLKDEAMAQVVVTPQVRGTPFTWRFTKMAALAGVTAALILAVSGVGLHLMLDDSGPTTKPAPGAVGELDPAEVVATVTGEFRTSRRQGPEEVAPDELAYLNRGLSLSGVVTADDMRLEGEYAASLSWDDFRPGLGGPATMVAAVRIESDSGAWDGALRGLTYDQMSDEPMYLQGLLTGSGDYAGQSAYLMAESADFVIEFHGLIFPGDMPAAPADTPITDSVSAVAGLDPAEVVAPVTGDLGAHRREGAADIVVTDIAYEQHGQVNVGRVTVDDARLEGDYRARWRWDDFRPGLGGPTTGTAAIRIENGAGTWEGVLQGLMYDHMADEPLYAQGRLAGSGDYAGQSAYLIAESDATLIRFHGLIFPGDMPE